MRAFITAILAAALAASGVAFYTVAGQRDEAMRAAGAANWIAKEAQRATERCLTELEAKERAVEAIARTSAEICGGRPIVEIPKP